ncbi:MAG: class I SAM-dependent methyltransferase [Patescibacteria group bacterium]|nr:class I SAM-dependent methyltransferase [Patescibacteria group bacterium]
MEDQTLSKHFCYACGGVLRYLFSAADYISAEIFAVYQCPACSLAATKPNPRPADFAKYYPRLYYGSRKSFTDSLINNSRRRKIKKIVVIAKKSVDKRSLLDIGCGDGGFIALLAAAGWRVAGTEMAAPGSHKQSASVSIYRRELLSCGFAKADFDLVTMWHSLEHLAEPLIYLQEVGRVLKKEGALLLEVPNFNSWQSVIFKNNWFHLDVPRHIFHYDKKSLELILKKANFKITKVSYGSLIYGLFGWIQSCLNVFCRRKNLLFDLLNGKAGWAGLKTRSIGAKDFAFIFILAIPAAIFSLPFFMLEVIFKRGGIITVWAERE